VVTPTCAVQPGLLVTVELDGLRREARGLRGDARRTDRPGWTVVDGWQFLGPARFSYSLDGAVRSEVGDSLTARVTEVLATPIRLVQSNYLFYDEGDFLGLHHDQARCPVTVIAVLAGDAEPLCTHPELVGAPAERLVTVVEGSGPCGGEPVDLGAGPVVIRGGELPHHRPPHRGSGSITVVTFCFTDAPPA
jgi:hypothetical protein